MSEQVRSTNEIDLKDLLRAILATRAWVVIALLVVTVGYWAVQTLVNFAIPTVHTYSSRINLVFKGVQNGNYPNGSPFSINDIVAPVVLNRVYDEDGLSAYINREDFDNAFSIAPYTPDRAFILKKYSDQLGSSKLTSAEIDALQTQLNSDLNNAARGSVALSFSSTKIANVPKSLIEKVLRDVPKEWARHMVEDVGVARFDQQIYTDKVVDSKMFESVDYLISFEMLLDRVSLLEDNIDKIKNMPNGLAVIDDKTGSSVTDLEKAVSDVQKYQIAPLVNQVKSLGIAKDPEVVRLYFQNELQQMDRDKQTLQQNKQDIEDAYASYVKNESMATSGSSTSAGGVSSGSMIPQIGADFLDRLVQMTDAGSDITYRQTLNKKLLDASNQLADQDAEIRRVQDVLDSIKQHSSAKEALRSEYAEKVTKQLPAILGELKGYFSVSDRMYAKLSRQELGIAGSMYRAADGDIISKINYNILSVSHLRLWLIICFLTIVIVVPAVMIRNAMRG